MAAASRVTATKQPMMILVVFMTSSRLVCILSLVSVGGHCHLLGHTGGLDEHRGRGGIGRQ